MQPAYGEQQQQHHRTLAAEEGEAAPAASPLTATATATATPHVQLRPTADTGSPPRSPAPSPTASEASTASSGSTLRPAADSDSDTPELPAHCKFETPTTATSIRINTTSSHPRLVGGDVPDVRSSDTPKKCTAMQATLNSANAMLGMGILSLPYALSLTGWIMGGLCLALFSLSALTTSKLIGRMLNTKFNMNQTQLPIHNHNYEHANVSETTALLSNQIENSTNLNVHANRIIKPESLADIGFIAFGTKGRSFISLFFTLELLAACTALLVISTDSLISLGLPVQSLHLKVIISVILFTTTLLPPSFLSYVSSVGLTTIISIVFVLIYNGLSIHGEGSLWEPRETYIWPVASGGVVQIIRNVGVSVGIIMVGLDAHAIFPGILKELDSRPVNQGRIDTHRETVSNIMNRAFGGLVLMYAVVASVGYLMFGNNVMPEIIKNFPLNPSYNPSLTTLILFLTAINPLTKYALIQNPISTHLQTCLLSTSLLKYYAPHLQYSSDIISKSLIIMSVLFISIIFPSFYQLMGILGSCFSFTIALIFPCACFLVLCERVYEKEDTFEDAVESYGGSESAKLREYIFCWAIVFLGCGFGLLGTIASISLSLR